MQFIFIKGSAVRLRPARGFSTEIEFREHISEDVGESF